MNRFILAACVASVLSLSSLFASSAAAGDLHKTIVVRPNGNVVKKLTYVPGHHRHHVQGAVIVKNNGVILRTPAIGIRIGR